MTPIPSEMWGATLLPLYESEEFLGEYFSHHFFSILAVCLFRSMTSVPGGSL